MLRAKKNGDPILCKFCKKPVWFDAMARRVYEVGGEVLHVENCPRRRAHYKQASSDSAQVQRDKKTP